MKKLSDYRSDYYWFSGKASDVARQLSFAGIALIWIFKQEKGGPLAVPQDLYWPAILFVVGLALDLFQYVLSAFTWGVFSRYQEWWKAADDDTELDAPEYFNWPSLACFWAKLAVVLIAYGMLFAFIFRLKS